MLHDLRHGLRLLARSPGFALAAIAVLALGIGLNTAVFSLTYAVAFSPRPFVEPERIVQLYTQDRTEPSDYRAFSYPLYRDIASRTDLFASVVAQKFLLVGLNEHGATRRSLATLVSANYFATFGVPLARGRAFTDAEERPGANLPVAIASFQYWRKTGFAADLVGSTVRVNERVFTVVGIAPEGFSGTTMLVGPEFYFPLGVFSQLSTRAEDANRRTLERVDAYNLVLVARLASGVAPASAGEALRALSAALEHDYPVEFKNKAIDLGPLPRLGTSTAPRREGPMALAGVLLLGLSGAMLLVVCLNLAGLLLARGHARRKEFAIRLALGGGRARLVRQLCTEGALLALGGGALGFALAATANDWLVAALQQRLPIALFLPAQATPVIVAATAAFGMLATVGFALGPALKLSRTDVFIALKNAAGDTEPRRRRWLPRHPLVVGQIALSLALLVAASLFVRMALRLADTDTGLAADHTVLVEVDAALGGYDEAQSRQLLAAVRERLAALPGVESASTAAMVPFGLNDTGRAIRRAGAAPATGAKPATAAEGRAYYGRWNAVTADYFSTVGLPLLRGRAFTPAEAAASGAPTAIIIDETLARRLWPDGDALGRQVQWADEAPVADRAAPTPMEVVGIVRTSRNDFDQRETGGNLYVPFGPGFRAEAFFHVRTMANDRAAALAALEPVRQAVREAAPGLPVFRVQTFAEHMESNVDVWLTRVASSLFGFFGLASMLVAVVGIYGVKAYSVSRRTREIGVRMALGARPAEVRAMILREGGAIVGAGLLLGLALALGIGQAMAALFVDVAAFDPLVFGGAATLFALAALVACWIPAVRATRVSPLEALRAE
ncbi:ADOP family duplicated permease [Oleiharenicola sp. Vm1]|uniref:ADOP family duplicated permease n=1 Tax=Oleiharenicola sp. Vm1 TaxID=3398393 RepID=UPI0039F4A9B1